MSRPRPRAAPTRAALTHFVGTPSLILGGVATWEREIMLERQCEGIAKAKDEGKYKGRKPAVAVQAEAIKRRCMERARANGEIEIVLNREHVARSQLRVQTRQWVMSRILAKKYGPPSRDDAKNEDRELTIKVIGGLPE